MAEKIENSPKIPSPPKSSELVEYDDEEVMSELHLGCPPNFSGFYTSHFTFSLSPVVEFLKSRCADHVKDEPSSAEQTIDLDEDGDLIVAQRTSWRADLKLADYVLYKMYSSPVFNGAVAVELGAGTVNFFSCDMFDQDPLEFRTWVCKSDHGVEILDNCARNVQINSGLLRSESTVKIRELDWLKPWLPLDLDPVVRDSWTSSEVDEVNRASVLLAADVIYSDELTDAFFSVLQKMICQHSEKALYLALEKRFYWQAY